MFSLRTRVLWAVVVLWSGAITCNAQQPAVKDYPVRSIRLVVPYVAGGAMDFIGHVLGSKIAQSTGQNMFIENRGGAGGAIGTDVVAKAAPDGYTILLTSSSHAILPTLYKSLPYDPVKDFAPIALLARSVGSVLVVHPSVPVHTVKEFVALAKARPGVLNYGTGGIGNSMHLAAESFSLAAGIRMTHVPYKGAGAAVVDLLAGRIETVLTAATAVAGYVRTDKLRGLALTAATRWEDLPNVPTMDEAGVKGYTYATWYGFWFPANTPAAYVTQMRNEVAKAFRDAATSHKFAEQGMIPTTSTPQELGKDVVDGIEYHRKLIARIGIQPE